MTPLTTRLRPVVLMIGLLAPAPLSADTIEVLRGDASRPIDVVLGTTVTVETDAPFAELAMASPAIADPSAKSARSIAVIGRGPGRTTLTLIADNGTITSAEVVVRSEGTGAPVTVMPPMPPAQRIAVTGGRAAEVVEVPIGGSVVIRTDAPFVDASVKPLNAAAGATISDQSFYIIGTRAGRARLSLIRGDGVPATVITIVTVPNMTGIE